MPKRHSPRRGSLAFYPRKRATSQKATFRSYGPGKGVQGLAGFPTYKVGMVHVELIEDRPGRPTTDQEIVFGATILETPPIKVVGLKAYEGTAHGLKEIATALRVDPKSDLERIFPSKGFDNSEEAVKEIRERSGDVEEVRALVHTLPRHAGIHKKRPEFVEILVRGDDVDSRLEYAFSKIGGILRISEVYEEGQYIDVSSVTKGKGFQGVIKRFGVSRLPHKSGKRVREVGSLGSRNPPWISWRVPRPGQMGYHKRVEYNKRILRIVQAEVDEEGSPKGLPTGANLANGSGFKNYGLVRNDSILLLGSVPGPSKRFIMTRHAYRPPRAAGAGKPKITFTSGLGEV